MKSEQEWLSEEIQVGDYTIAFLDVLGQSDAIQGLRKLPATRQELPEYLEALKQTLGKRDFFRRSMDLFFHGFGSDPLPETSKTLPADEKARYDEFCTCNVRHFRFADTVVAFSPLYTNQCPALRSIYGILNACGALMIAGLAGKAPLRGAITIGAGAVAENEIYGPGFLDAYKLESTVAQYPRVVVGQELVRFLQDHTTVSGEDVQSRLVRGVARICLNLLAEDEDGVTILDYLGRESREQAAGPEVDEVIPTILSFVQTEYARFRARQDTKLASRYAWLNRYLSSRSGLWMPSKGA